MTEHGWQIEWLDLEAYLTRIGLAAQPPSRSALDRLLEANVRTFTFDNIDVLLEQHPGVRLDSVQNVVARAVIPAALGVPVEQNHVGSQPSRFDFRLLYQMADSGPPR